jgi:glycosyltransferase involved in cell wall biosynthesis
MHEADILSAPRHGTIQRLRHDTEPTSGLVPVAEPERGAPELSVVVPVFNEGGSVAELHAQIGRALGGIGRPAEIIFVDDGSTDGSGAILDALAQGDPRITVAHFRRNYGKAAALDLAFGLARGAVVVTLDADLQDDPAEISRFLATLAEGYDVVSGWKRDRHDPLDKTLPSLVFNWFGRRVSGLPLHDFNCGFKAYRREALAELRLYGELHRFIPILLHWEGFRIGEIAVAHRPRSSGTSKFGPRRLLTGAFDLLTVLLTTRFRSRPLHFFGLAAIGLGALGSAGMAALFLLSVLGLDPMRPRPLLYASILCILTAVPLIAAGLLGELIKSLGPPGADYRLRSISLPPLARPDQARDRERR